MTESRRTPGFEQTPEPPREQGTEDLDPLTATVGEVFVIHQHHATRLHHDVRLEMYQESGTPVLVSWAVPKRLPMRKGERHLAIRTEDHPIEYATFAGTIEEGGYGAGEVRVFDAGTYELVKRGDDRFTVRLVGDRIRGVYHMVRTGVDRGKEQWLALLSSDEREPGEPMPALRPMMATVAAEPFDDPEWVFEPKWDGVRALAVCREATSLISRNGNDITDGYPELHHLHQELAAADAVVDGEIVALENGVPSFQRLQSRMHVRDPGRLEKLIATTPVVLMAFDLLYVDGRDITGLGYRQRRELLEDCVVATDTLQLSPAVTGDGVALFDAAAAQNLEGIVAKRRDSRYRPGARSGSWLKVKTVFDADVVVVGWSEGGGRRTGTLGSVAMALYGPDGLRYVGSVGTGFDAASLGDTLDRLRAIAAEISPLPKAASGTPSELRGLHWVRPELVATVEYRQVTEAGRLRAPSFKTFRDDKAPHECTLDQLSIPAGRAQPD